MTISNEDIKFIEFAYSLINSAKYPDFNKVTETYNRVFNANLKNTSCGSCIRQRIIKLKETADALQREFADSLTNINDDDAPPSE